MLRTNNPGWPGLFFIGRRFMAKGKQLLFFCQNCGFESAKWQGQCPACKEWNTFVEGPVVHTSKGVKKQDKLPELKNITEIEVEHESRTTTGISELDRVLGGGLVQGSLILVGGDPGIGKSTLLLQVCKNLADQRRNILYI